jgi:hypothetical protein
LCRHIWTNLKSARKNLTSGRKKATKAAPKRTMVKY